LSAATIPSLTLGLDHFFGIGGTYVGFAVLMLVTTLPLMALTRKRFRPLIAIEAYQSRIKADDITLRDAARTRAFWLMAFGMPIVAGAVSSIIIHSHSLMTDSGLSLQDATWVTSLLGPALFVGRLLTGRLLDRFTARQVIMGVFLFPTIACVILSTFNGSLMLAVIATLFTGVAAGAEGDMLAYFTSRYFGVRHYGQIYGFLLGLFSIGYGSFPPVVGLLFDIFGSYNYAFALVGALLVVGVTLLYFLGDYPEGAAH
jgi:MFS family permease